MFLYSISRLSCILLQKYHTFVNSTEIMNIVKKVEAISLAQSQKNESEEQVDPALRNSRLFRWLSTENLISPLPMTQFPQVCSFKPNPYPSHLRPHRTEAAVSCHSEFLNNKKVHVYKVEPLIKVTFQMRTPL